MPAPDGLLDHVQEHCQQQRFILEVKVGQQAFRRTQAIALTEPTVKIAGDRSVPVMAR